MESSSEESDADDISSLLFSQWKRRRAKPTEADSSDDGRSDCGKKDAGTLIVTLRSFKNCFFEFLSPGHEHYTLGQQFHSFMGKQASIFISLADESWVYSYS